MEIIGTIENVILLEKGHLVFLFFMLILSVALIIISSAVSRSNRRTPVRAYFSLLILFFGSASIFIWQETCFILALAPMLPLAIIFLYFLVVSKKS